MSKIQLAPPATGSATFTIASPATSTDRTLTLPNATTTLVGTDATQTLTNKTIQGGALTLETVKTATGPVVDFTGLPSWVKRITMTWRGVSTSGTSLPLVQLGTGSTTWTTTGYGPGGFNQVGTFTTSTSGFGGYNAWTATWVMTAEFVVTLFDEATNTWACRHMMTGSAGPGFYGNGSVALPGALTAIRATMANGTDTFDAGTINILYEG